MSWMAKLYETYEVGKRLESVGGAKLMPICHTLQNAHINIVIDNDGVFKRASVLEKTQVVLPASEKSAGRSSGEAPHPLADKIQYVAKDYPDYGGRKKSYFAGYEKQLSDWCSSEFRHEKAIAVYKYICNGSVVDDLISEGVLHVGQNKELLAYWPDGDREPPLIFKVLPPIPKNKRVNKDKSEIEQGDALICWSVEVEGEPDSATWQDESLQQKWIEYDNQSLNKTAFCFILGHEMPIAVNHPAKLRHTGDKAKIISANDSSGFTFRGRFTDSGGSQAASVSYEITQKAHNALRWLISRQGFRNGDQVFVSWAVSGKEIPKPLESTWNLFNSSQIIKKQVDDEDKKPPDHSVDLGESFARRLKNYMAGYYANLKPNEQIVVMGLNSATPGRMSVIYYRTLMASEFLERLEKWHDQFAWPQRYTKELTEPGSQKKPSKKIIWPVSSPAPYKIAEAAYGSILKNNDSLRKSIIERILPCIIDGRSFPHDLIISAVRRACNRNNYEKWEWERNLGIACSLYKGFYLRNPNERREYNMTLEEKRTTRDYLYGRLLAVAEKIEETALYVGGEERPTTAARLMQRFADRPYSTWRNIELALQPYMQRLQANRAGFLVNRKKELDSIMDAFLPDEFKSKKSLSGEFLLGYHCQRQVWQKKSEEEKVDN